MIEINLNTARYKLTVTGHAQPEESKEYSAICSAVSALAQSLFYCVSKFNDGEGSMKSVEYRGDPGDLLLRVWPEEWAESAIRHRFKNYGDGMELLAKSHPEAVSMIWDGERIVPEEAKNE